MKNARLPRFLGLIALLALSAFFIIGTRAQENEIEGEPDPDPDPSTDAQESNTPEAAEEVAVNGTDNSGNNSTVNTGQMGRGLLNLNLLGGGGRQRSRYNNDDEVLVVTTHKKYRPRKSKTTHQKRMTTAKPSESTFNANICPINGSRPEPLKRVYRFTYKTANGEIRFWNDTRLFPFHPVYYLLWMPTSTYGAVHYVRLVKFVQPPRSIFGKNPAKPGEEFHVRYHRRVRRGSLRPKRSAYFEPQACDVVEVGKLAQFKFNQKFADTRMHGMVYDQWIKAQDTFFDPDTVAMMREEFVGYWIRAFGGSRDDAHLWKSVKVAEDSESATRRETSAVKPGKEPDLARPQKMPDGGKFVAIDEVYTEAAEDEQWEGANGGSASSGGEGRSSVSSSSSSTTTTDGDEPGSTKTTITKVTTTTTTEERRRKAKADAEKKAKGASSGSSSNLEVIKGTEGNSKGKGIADLPESLKSENTKEEEAKAAVESKATRLGANKEASTDGSTGAGDSNAATEETKGIGKVGMAEGGLTKGQAEATVGTDGESMKTVSLDESTLSDGKKQALTSESEGGGAAGDTSGTNIVSKTSEHATDAGEGSGKDVAEGEGAGITNESEVTTNDVSSVGENGATAQGVTESEKEPSTGAVSAEGENVASDGESAAAVGGSEPSNNESREELITVVLGEETVPPSPAETSVTPTSASSEINVPLSEASDKGENKSSIDEAAGSGTGDRNGAVSKGEAGNEPKNDNGEVGESTRKVNEDSEASERPDSPNAGVKEVVKEGGAGEGGSIVSSSSTSTKTTDGDEPGSTKTTITTVTTTTTTEEQRRKARADAEKKAKGASSGSSSNLEVIKGTEGNSEGTGATGIADLPESLKSENTKEEGAKEGEALKATRLGANKEASTDGSIRAGDSNAATEATGEVGVADGGLTKGQAEASTGTDVESPKTVSLDESTLSEGKTQASKSEGEGGGAAGDTSGTNTVPKTSEQATDAGEGSGKGVAETEGAGTANESKVSASDGTFVGKDGATATKSETKSPTAVVSAEGGNVASDSESPAGGESAAAVGGSEPTNIESKEKPTTTVIVGEETVPNSPVFETSVAPTSAGSEINVPLSEASDKGENKSSIDEAAGSGMGYGNGVVSKGETGNEPKSDNGEEDTSTSKVNQDSEVSERSDSPNAVVKEGGTPDIQSTEATKEPAPAEPSKNDETGGEIKGDSLKAEPTEVDVKPTANEVTGSSGQPTSTGDSEGSGKPSATDDTKGFEAPSINDETGDLSKKDEAMGSPSADKPLTSNEVGKQAINPEESSNKDKPSSTNDENKEAVPNGQAPAAAAKDEVRIPLLKEGSETPIVGISENGDKTPVTSGTKPEQHEVVDKSTASDVTGSSGQPTSTGDSEASGKPSVTDDTVGFETPSTKNEPGELSKKVETMASPSSDEPLTSNLSISPEESSNKDKASSNNEEPVPKGEAGQAAAANDEARIPLLKERSETAEIPIVGISENGEKTPMTSGAQPDHSAPYGIEAPSSSADAGGTTSTNDSGVPAVVMVSTSGNETPIAQAHDGQIPITDEGSPLKSEEPSPTLEGPSTKDGSSSPMDGLPLLKVEATSPITEEASPQNETPPSNGEPSTKDESSVKGEEISGKKEEPVQKDGESSTNEKEQQVPKNDSGGLTAKDEGTATKDENEKPSISIKDGEAPNKNDEVSSTSIEPELKLENGEIQHPVAKNNPEETSIKSGSIGTEEPPSKPKDGSKPPLANGEQPLRDNSKDAGGSATSQLPETGTGQDSSSNPSAGEGDGDNKLGVTSSLLSGSPASNFPQPSPSDSSGNNDGDKNKSSGAPAVEPVNYEYEDEVIELPEENGAIQEVSSKPATQNGDMATAGRRRGSEPRERRTLTMPAWLYSQSDFDAYDENDFEEPQVAAVRRPRPRTGQRAATKEEIRNILAGYNIDLDAIDGFGGTAGGRRRRVKTSGQSTKGTGRRSGTVGAGGKVTFGDGNYNDLMKAFEELEEEGDVDPLDYEYDYHIVPMAVRTKHRRGEGGSHVVNIRSKGSSARGGGTSSGGHFYYRPSGSGGHVVSGAGSATGAHIVHNKGVRADASAAAAAGDDAGGENGNKMSTNGTEGRRVTRTRKTRHCKNRQTNTEVPLERCKGASVHGGDGN